MGFIGRSGVRFSVMAAAAALLFGASGCGRDDEDDLVPAAPARPAPNPEPERPSGGITDAGETDDDAGTSDGGFDAGVPDGGFDAGAPDAGTPDAGSPVDAGTPDAGPVDAGAPDAGTAVDAGAPDAGGPVDAGAPDAGPKDAGMTVVLPTAAGWQFYGVQQGGPQKVLGVSADGLGNIWVAGGTEGLFVLKPGATNFLRFTHADGLAGFTDANGVQGYPVISVAGGNGGTVYVGYKGLSGADSDGASAALKKSGDADKVVFNGATIAVTHIDISSPPGMYDEYPNGREKIYSVHRILPNKATGDVWFGGNHGVALLEQNGLMWEHQHADINGFTDKTKDSCVQSAPDKSTACIYTLLSGDYHGIALAQNGDFVFGAAHRVARLAFGQNRQFWASMQKIDVWPDAKAANAYPWERTDDFIQDMAAQGDSFWVGSIRNGIAKLTPTGVDTVSGMNGAMIDPKVTSLEVDPSDGSIWVGHLWGGITRFQGGNVIKYDYRVFGEPIINGTVPDIQSDHHGGQRRILVAFDKGVLGVFTGN